MTFDVPEDHIWQDPPAPAPSIHDAQVLAHGAIRYDPALIQPGMEAPNGLYFTFVAFAGSLQEWLRDEQAVATKNPVDPQTIQELTIAQHPALAFSYMAVGLGDSRTVLIKPSPERLLIIQDSGYGPVLDGLQISHASK